MTNNIVADQIDETDMNSTPIGILKNTVFAAFGLFIFGFGVYLTIQANIGVAPWDAFNLGIAHTLGMLYGDVFVIVSGIIIIIDLLLKEHIGIGTVLDAVVVGKTVDFFNWIDLVPVQKNLWIGIVMMIAGFFIMGFAQFIYMRAGLCCGPRDALMVGIGRRLNKIPIGAVNILILIVILFFGWRLNGPIGIGTLIGTVAMGTMMQLAFNIVKFEPKDVKHQSIIESVRIVLKRTNV